MWNQKPKPYNKNDYKIKLLSKINESLAENFNFDIMNIIKIKC